MAAAADRLNEGLREAARLVALLPEDEQFVPRFAGEDGTPSAVAQGTRALQAFDHLRREFTHDQAAGLWEILCKSPARVWILLRLMNVKELLVSRSGD